MGQFGGRWGFTNLKIYILVFRVDTSRSMECGYQICWICCLYLTRRWRQFTAPQLRYIYIHTQWTVRCHSSEYHNVSTLGVECLHAIVTTYLDTACRMSSAGSYWTWSRIHPYRADIYCRDFCSILWTRTSSRHKYSLRLADPPQPKPEVPPGLLGHTNRHTSRPSSWRHFRPPSPSWVSHPTGITNLSNQPAVPVWVPTTRGTLAA